MTTDNKKASKNATSKKTKILIIAIVIIAILIVGFFFGPNWISKGSKSASPNFSEVERICELATLKCYYHDVAEWKKEPDPIFKNGLFRYGYKKMWIEYDGIVEIGINVKDVTIEQPDSKGHVIIHIPEAKVLEIDVDTNSMGDPIVETGILTSITFEEQAEALAFAQSVMKESAESNSSLLSYARNNAKELLKQYVLHVGELMGKEFTVEFVDSGSTAAE